MKQKSTILFALLLAVVLLLAACTGAAGGPGAKGEPGDWGEVGAAGKSAYEIWLDAGYTGTEADFADWLKGEPGKQGEAGAAGIGIDHVEFTKANEIYVVLNDEAQTRLFVCQTSASEGLGYEIEDDEAYITGLAACKDTDLVIPRTIEGCPVVGVDLWAFYDCDIITSVAFPETVTYIDIASFYDCDLLTEVYIPDSVTNLEDRSFADCDALERVTLSKNLHYICYGVFRNCALTSVELPAGIRAIDESAFAGCASLTSVTIPGSVETIWHYAFEDCVSLTSVTIEEGVKAIFGSAFKGCTELTAVSLPGSVEYVDEFAFVDCPALQFAIYDHAKYLGNAQNPYHALIAGTSKEITSCTVHPDTKLLVNGAFAGCEELASVTLPNGLEHVGCCAFDGCEKLQGTVYENAVYLGNAENPYLLLVNAENDRITACAIHSDTKLIADEAFYECDEMEDLTLPAGLTYIGNFAFYSCTALESVHIPDGVVYLGKSAFEDCLALESVNIPVGVTALLQDAFTGCYNLKTITYGGTEEQWNAIWKDYFWDLHTGVDVGGYTVVFAVE